MMKYDDKKENSPIEAEMFNYFMQKRDYYRNTLLKPLKDDAGATLLGLDIVKYEWIDRAQWIIATDMCITLKLGIDPVMDFVQKINMTELFN